MGGFTLSQKINDVHHKDNKDLPGSPQSSKNHSDSSGKPPIKNQMSRLTLDGFDNFISRLGLNNDNTLSGGTYEYNLVTRNRVLLEAAYRGSWIVGQIVDSVADDMTRAKTIIYTSAQDDLKIFNKMTTRLQIWRSLNTLIRWGRLYGGALGVMQIEGQDPATPLDVSTIGKGQFKGIAIYDRWMLNPRLFEVITKGPNIGLPAFYDLVTSPLNSSTTAPPMTGEITIHHTRCIRYIGILLPFFQAITEMMWGESCLERLWDRLISFDNASLSAFQLIDRANLRTIGIDGYRQIVASGGEAMEGLLSQIETMRLLQVNEGLTITDKEDTFQTTAYSFAGLSDMLLQGMQQLAGAAEIPLVRLFGQLPAGLGTSGEADIRMYYDSINAKQESNLRDPLDTLYKVMWASCFGKSLPDDFDFEFKSLWQMDELDQANITKTNAESIIAAHQDGLLSTPTAMKELKDISGESGLFNNISDLDIAEAELEPPPLPDVTPISEEKSEEEKEPVKDKKWISWFKR